MSCAGDALEDAILGEADVVDGGGEPGDPEQPCNSQRAITKS